MSPLDGEIRAHLAGMLDAARAEAERSPYITDDPVATLRAAREALALLDAVQLCGIDGEAEIGFHRVLRDSLNAVRHVERVLSPDGAPAA